MLRQPALFTVGQLQLLVCEQYVAAGAPAFGDGFFDAGGDGHEQRIDDAEQLWIVLVHGKTETVGLMFAEVGHADVVQVALVDHVMG
ncbi:hypothetical protein D3C76_1025440 [compost metagenome]